mmetsp:Transcript_82439/g.229754  ORF Transcript_82439/g.229754 Transcript_82439/m.229754 type:complete len:275 (-) Transcript_82439:142-966(-)
MSAPDGAADEGTRGVEHVGDVAPLPHVDPFTVFERLFQALQVASAERQGGAGARGDGTDAGVEPLATSLLGLGEDAQALLRGSMFCEFGGAVALGAAGADLPASPEGVPSSPETASSFGASLSSSALSALLAETLRPEGQDRTVSDDVETGPAGFVGEHFNAIMAQTLTPEGGLDGGLLSVLNRLAFDSASPQGSQIFNMVRLQRLSTEEIIALPTVPFDGVDKQTCPICLEAYQKGEILTKLRCNHVFHVSCIASWVRRATNCPMCRGQCTEG